MSSSTICYILSSRRSRRVVRSFHIICIKHTQTPAESRTRLSAYHTIYNVESEHTEVRKTWTYNSHIGQLTGLMGTRVATDQSTGNDGRGHVVWRFVRSVIMVHGGFGHTMRYCVIFPKLAEFSICALLACRCNPSTLIADVDVCIVHMWWYGQSICAVRMLTKLPNILWPLPPAVGFVELKRS